MTTKKGKRYSVLLYWRQDYGDGETYYAFVTAPTPADAVEKAVLKAAKAWWGGEGLGKDDLKTRANEFDLLLVTEGWHKAVY